jgi:ketosteroid isomerase-like protein
VSGDDAAVIRRFTDAFNERNIDGMLALSDEEVEILPMRAQLEGRSYRGHAGFRELLADLDEDWEYIVMDIDEIREADDALAVLGHIRSRGRASGVDVDVPMGWVWRLRAGKVAYGKAYSDQADALRAAGLA